MMYNAPMKQSELEAIVTQFLDQFFEEEAAVAQDNFNFIDENGFETPRVGYIRLRRFLNTAVNNLKNLDPNLITGLLGKLYTDIERLHEFNVEFKRKTKIAEVVYRRDFLETVPAYKQLQEEVTITDGLKNRYHSISRATDNELMNFREIKTAEDEKAYKELKKRNVDAIFNFGKAKEKLAVLSTKLKELEEYMRAEFFRQYDEYVQYYAEAFEEIINTKTFYFDKLLWFQAEKSSGIRKFFADARIDGDYSTKTYMKYYLRNIDIDKSRDSDWHRYLREMMELLE